MKSKFFSLLFIVIIFVLAGCEKNFSKQKTSGNLIMDKFIDSLLNLAFYTENMDYTAEKGEFKIYVGINSRDGLETYFTLK